MKVRFEHNTVPFEQTMVFEEMYHKNLQVTPDIKQELSDLGAQFIFMFDNEENKLIGQTYFIQLDALKLMEDDSDLQAEDGLDRFYYQNGAYFYGTEILPEYQHKGLGKLIKSYAIGVLTGYGYSFAMGHARVSTGSIDLNEGFGAIRIKGFPDWYKTGELYILYKIKL